MNIPLPRRETVPEKGTTSRIYSMILEPPNDALFGAEDGGIVKDRQSKPVLVNSAAEFTGPKIVPASESAGGIEPRANTRYAFTAAAEVLEPRSGARIAGRIAEISSGGC